MSVRACCARSRSASWLLNAWCAAPVVHLVGLPLRCCSTSSPAGLGTKRSTYESCRVEQIRLGRHRLEPIHTALRTCTGCISLATLHSP